MTSLTRQTFTDYELIVVDDGSTDRSGVILDAFDEADIKQLTLIRQSNKGQSVARNRAIEAAKGEWLVFVDADDYVDTDYLQRIADILPQTDEHKADVLQLYKPFYHATAPWTRVLRRSFVMAHQLRFPIDMRAYEDIIFSLHLWAAHPHHMSKATNGYHYNTHADSNSRAADRQSRRLLLHRLWQTPAPLWLRLYTWIRILTYWAL